MAGRLLCFGFGYTARAFARRLAPSSWRVAGTARSAASAAEIEAAGLEAVLWPSAGFAPNALEGFAAALISSPPDGAGCPTYRAAHEALGAVSSRLCWIGYLSSNGVYGDHKGAWVDETSHLRATSERGLQRIAAEAQWARFGVEWSVPTVIFRLPGIYGPGRSALDTVREGRAQRIFKNGQVFNRMHVDDIAAALAASLADPAAGDLFNLADDEPSPPQDVIAFACALLGVEPPPLVPIEEAQLSEMGRSFYDENKRVSNALMKQALAVSLQYPTYREGLTAIAKETGAS
jgi:nucleoside-diphosphate-sugar epimerase